MTDEEMREALAQGLLTVGIWWGRDRPGVADTLLPTVRKIVADQLREAAFEMSGRMDALNLRRRADALDPA